LFVRISGATFKREDVVVVGEFRNTRVHPSFSVGEVLAVTEFGEAYTEGVLLKQEDDVMFYAMNPVRKWKYDGKLRPMDHYVFTLFVVVNRKVVATKDSPSFSVTPIWKASGEGGDEAEEGDEAVGTKVTAVTKVTAGTKKRTLVSASGAEPIQTRFRPSPDVVLTPPPPPPSHIMAPQSMNPNEMLQPTYFPQLHHHHHQQQQQQQQPSYVDFPVGVYRGHSSPFASQVYGSHLLPGLSQPSHTTSLTSPGLWTQGHGLSAPSSLPSLAFPIQHFHLQQPQQQPPYGSFSGRTQFSNSSAAAASAAGMMYRHSTHQQHDQ
jgi:hypothetical protein